MTESELQKQIGYEPLVRRPLADAPRAVVIGGMGGSALAGDALLFLDPARTVVIHRDYGLPKNPPENALYVALSYSGTTEETLSFANAARAAGLPLAIVTSGGALESLAEKEGLPIAPVPTGYAPRNAFLYMVRALLALIQAEEQLVSIARTSVDMLALGELAERDAHVLLQSVPLIYTSERNILLGRMSKLIFNETARTPAFSNVFPELNHNEMQAFDTDMPEGIEHLFKFVLVEDAQDDARVVRRMQVFKQLMEERGRSCSVISIGDNRVQALIDTWMHMLTVARFLGETRAINPDTAPLVEAFKKLL